MDYGKEYMKLMDAIKKSRQNPVCMETDPELWFPDTGDGRGAARIAKRYCGECPVQTECLAFAMKTNQYDGIWGGLTAKERQSLRGRGRGRPLQSRPNQSRRPD